MVEVLRRQTVEVNIGGTSLGGKNPIRVQTMTTTNTNDTDLTARQCIRAAKAGAEYVRITTQGEREAANLQNIKAEIVRCGYKIPLVADVHFNPAAALEAAKHVEKVRINPGNFIDPRAKFVKVKYTDEEYQVELQRVEEKLVPLINVCYQRNVAIRIGVNHGSLSDRIMSRYGDTPAGMVESAMEFLRIFRKYGFKALVISMKSSNTRVMVQAVRLLVKKMDAEDMHYPLHLGVTEAGDGEDARIKSAVGIGALLADGLGDTIRVSLTEEPEAEIPVAQKLVSYFENRVPLIDLPSKYEKLPYNPFEYERRKTMRVNGIGGNNPPVVIADFSNYQTIDQKHYGAWGWRYNEALDSYEQATNTAADIFYMSKQPLFGIQSEQCFPIITSGSVKHYLSNGYDFIDIKNDDLNDPVLLARFRNDQNIVLILHTNNPNGYADQRAAMVKLMNADVTLPVILHRTYTDTDVELFQLKAAADLGALLIDGFGDGIMITAPGIPHGVICSTAFSILQAARTRLTKTEYIACPGCGRTLYNLQKTLKQVKAATQHLNGLKIGVMGCIVNGPGEMADADYGYVGAAAGKISLYKGKTLVKMNIPESDAIAELIALIKENGDWKDND